MPLRRNAVHRIDTDMDNDESAVIDVILSSFKYVDPAIDDAPGLRHFLARLLVERFRSAGYEIVKKEQNT